MCLVRVKWHTEVQSWGGKGSCLEGGQERLPEGGAPEVAQG